MTKSPMTGAFIPTPVHTAPGLTKSASSVVLIPIACVVAIFNESVADPVNLALITDHELVECSHLAGKISFDEAGIEVLVFKGHWE